MTHDALTASILEYGVAGEALEGTDSGDLHVCVESNGIALVAVIDGLGHGLEAAIAAREAAAILEAHAQEDVDALIRRCHEGLRKTRGVVMALAAFDARASSMTWVGVGNIDAVLLRAEHATGRSEAALNTRGGVVGFRLPPLRVDTVAVSRGDTLIAATDGLRSGFSDGAVIERDPNELACELLARFRMGSDDALVLVARSLGAAT
jgi:serine phosphatase RsbU (regulator of sigma subunit)